MSRYTMSFMDILSGNPSDENIEAFRTKLFDFDYNFFSDEHKKFLETQFIRHYIEYDIGQSTMGLFKMYLKNYFQLEVGTYYNELYKAADMLKPYENSGFVRTINSTGHDILSGKTTDVGEITNTSTTDSTDKTDTKNDITSNTDGTTKSDTSSSNKNVNSVIGSQTNTKSDTGTVSVEDHNTNMKNGQESKTYGQRSHMEYEYPVGNVDTIKQDFANNGTKDSAYTDSTSYDHLTDQNDGTHTTTNNTTSTDVTTYSDDYKNTTTDDGSQIINGETHDNTTSSNTGSSNSTNNTKTDGTQNSSVTKDENSTTDRTNDTTEQIIGLTASKAEEFKKYFDALRNIDKMVIESREARELFLLIY